MKLLTALVVIIACSGLSWAQTTQPTRADLEFRAQQSFARGDYASALPILRKLSADAGDTSRLSTIQEQIRVCERNLAANQPAPTTAPASAARQPHVKPKDGEVLEIPIQTLGNFDYDADKGGNIPADVLALTGSRLRLNGYMVPIDQTDKITKFALVPSLFSCCYGQPPQIQHTVVVSCPAGKAVTYYPDEIRVEGTLKVEEKKDDGYIVSLFELEAASIKPAAK